jgi:hypothetical protein
MTQRVAFENACQGAQTATREQLGKASFELDFFFLLQASLSTGGYRRPTPVNRGHIAPF